MSIPSASATGSFCGECGTAFSAGENYCSRCGHARDVSGSSPVIPLDRGATVAPPADPSPTSTSDVGPRRPRWRPWAMGGLVALLVLSTAGLALALGGTRSSLDSAKADLAAVRQTLEERGVEVDSLEADLDEVEGRNSELNALNSELRAAAQSCQEATALSERFLQAIAQVGAGFGDYGKVLRLGRRVDSAMTDCEARVTALGF